MSATTSPVALVETEEQFVKSLQDGRKIEAWDWMPDAYRESMLRIAAQQAIAEVIGSTMFSDWLDAAPTLERKATLLAKVQDELGHGHVALRVCEDLGMSREEVMAGYLAGEIKLLNTFHYDFQNWAEIGPVRVLMTGAALVQFASLAQSSYLPYARAVKKVLKEESYHYQEACDLTLTLLAAGDPQMIEQMQRGVDEWYPRMLAYFGPSDVESRHSELMQAYRLKLHTNDDLRQQWLSKVVPLLRGWGLSIPDDELVQVAPGVWNYTRPDWDKVKRVLKGGGPSSERRRAHAERYYQRADWLQEALDAQALAQAA